MIVLNLIFYSMPNNNWWKKAFGQIYLDGFLPLYSSEKTKIEVDCVVKQMNLKKGDSVLDISCGSGRHSLVFAKKGLQVVGVDYSKEVLNEARKNAKMNNLSIKFVKQDIRKLKIEKKFDGAVMLGNSFGYFNEKDNEKVVANIAKILKKNGKFFLDLPNTAGMFRNLSAKSKHKIPGGYMIATNKSFDPVSCILFMEWEVVVNNKKDILNGQFRLYLLPEIIKLFEKYSLKFKKVFGSYSNDKYTIDTPRMLVVYEKV